MGRKECSQACVQASEQFPLQKEMPSGSEQQL